MVLQPPKTLRGEIFPRPNRHVHVAQGTGVSLGVGAIEVKGQNLRLRLRPGDDSLQQRIVPLGFQDIRRGALPGLRAEQASTACLTHLPTAGSANLPGSGGSLG